MYKCFRLKKGMDLKEEIEDFVIKNKTSGAVISGVGSLSHLIIRLADGDTILERDEEFEIVSLMGTLSEDGVHLHIAVSSKDGNTLGGHLKNGSIINTTCEVVLLLFSDIKLKREFDDDTGYDELVILENKEVIPKKMNF